MTPRKPRTTNKKPGREAEYTDVDLYGAWIKAQGRCNVQGLEHSRVNLMNQMRDSIPNVNDYYFNRVRDFARKEYGDTSVIASHGPYSVYGHPEDEIEHVAIAVTASAKRSIRELGDYSNLIRATQTSFAARNILLTEWAGRRDYCLRGIRLAEGFGLTSKQSKKLLNDVSSIEETLVKAGANLVTGIMTPGA